jgi:hypothetical protein
MRRLSGLFAVTGLVSASLLAPSIASAAASHGALALPAGALAGDTVAQGHLIGANGRAVSGALVVVDAWPDASVLSKLRPGQRVPVKQVGSAVTTASGQYTIAIQSLASLRSAAAADGTVNLEVMSAAGAGAGAFSFSRRLAPTADGTVLDTPASTGVTQVAAAEAVNLRVTAAAVTDAPAVVPCGWVYLKNYGPRWAVVGATFARTGGVTQSFSYGRGQSSSLGVGLSQSGKYGTFSESGTASASSSTQEDYPTFGGNTSVRYETKFIYGEYGYSCSHGYLRYETRPTGYAGGATYVKTTAPSAGYCVYQARGTTFTRSSSSAYTFTAGLNVSAVGVNLSSETGYDSSATVRYHFSASHHLCGTGGYPGGTPRRLVAEP